MAGSLTHTPAQIVRQLLITLGVAKLPPAKPWPAYFINEPPSPDNLITVYTTVGKKHGKTMPDKERQLHHGIQIRVRANTDNVGYKKMNEIVTALDDVERESFVVDGTATYTIQNVVVVGDIIQLPKPATTGKLPEVEEERSVHVVNLLVPIRQGEVEDEDLVDDPSPVGGLDADFTFDEGEGTEITG
jgi:hypothetical protein